MPVTTDQIEELRRYVEISTYQPALRLRTVRAVLDEVTRLRAEVASARAFLAKTGTGGHIVSSAACTPEELAFANDAGRMHVTPDGLGYVYRAHWPPTLSSSPAAKEVDRE